MRTCIIGDSHVLVYAGRSDVEVLYVGAATAHNLCRLKSSNRSAAQVVAWMQQQQNFSDIQAVLCFGEIDCRLHILKAVAAGEGSIVGCIAATIHRYMLAWEMMRVQGLKVLLHGITPAARQENIYHVANYGSQEVRNHVNFEFNRQLAIAAKSWNVPYFDIFDLPYTVEEDGGLSRVASSDGVHLNPLRCLIGQDLLCFINRNS